MVPNTRKKEFHLGFLGCHLGVFFSSLYLIQSDSSSGSVLQAPATLAVRKGSPVPIGWEAELNFLKTVMNLRVFLKQEIFRPAGKPSTVQRGCCGKILIIFLFLSQSILTNAGYNFKIGYVVMLVSQQTDISSTCRILNWPGCTQLFALQLRP
jgi:hypothetical protein